MKNKDLMFICRRCGHRTWLINFREHPEKINKLLKSVCPECKEKGSENWILGRWGYFVNVA